jgi:hypothetical protein
MKYRDFTQAQLEQIGNAKTIGGDWLIEAFEDRGVLCFQPVRVHRAFEAMIKCTDVLGNIAFIHTDDGKHWRCTLNNGIPAGFSYAIGASNEMELKARLRRVTTPTDALLTVKEFAYSRYKVELV